MKPAHYIGTGFAALLLSACTSTSTDRAFNSAASANILAHRNASDELPVSTERMALAISRYNENDSEKPVKMHTTDDVTDD